MTSQVFSIPHSLSRICLFLAIIAFILFLMLYAKMRKTDTFKEIVKYYKTTFIPLAISVLLFIGYNVFDIKSKTGHRVIYYEGHRYEYVKDIQPQDTIIVDNKAWVLKDHYRK